MSVDALSDLMPGSSPFHYCFNNPLILRDPSGLIGEIGGDGIPRFTTGEVVCEADGPWRHWRTTAEGARRGNEWMNGQGASRMGSPTAADRVGMGAKESGHGSSPSTGVIDGIQTSLDVVGLADPTGIADGVNAIVYVLRGRWGDAAISGMGILPYVGDLGKVGRLSGKAVRYTIDQQALIDLAKQAKKYGGVTMDEAKILREWSQEYDVVFRGPEVHPNRNFNVPHLHIGPVNHIKIK